MTVAPGPTSPTRTGPLSILRRQWLPIVLALLTAVFIAQNRDSASIDVLTFSVRAPLWFVLTLVFCVGAACGWLLAWRRTRASARAKG